MKRANYCKTGLLLTTLFTGILSSAQTVIPPAQKGNTSFVVVIDSTSYAHCTSQVKSYKTTLEAEGLPTFVAYKTWQSPEEVKQLLEKLYREEKLEGAVFIGDIPVPMITKAQHLTSAFKMDERSFPLREASVPSDRFYEDFDLKFIPLADSTQGMLFFYQMAPDSPQTITCDIYSGRIRPQASNGDPYRQIASYLEKAVKAHKTQNQFDQFVSFTGHGSYSNSLVAWRSEQQLMNEQFPGIFSRQRGMKLMRYSMAPYMKENVIKELRRPELDMMVFHEHGMPDRQYLTGDQDTYTLEDNIALIRENLRAIVRRDADKENPFARAKAEADELGVDSTWYCDALDPTVQAQDSLTDLQRGIILEDVNDIRPNARFVIFDACYNGDFREKDYIAGKYIFSDGMCVAAFANSVNVLQDKSAFDLLGLLACGTRLGIWARHINILESHIHGDPTFRFTSTFNEEMNTASLQTNDEYWKNKLASPIPDVQNYALIRLYLNRYPGISDLLYDTFCRSPHAVVRYNCLHLLEAVNDANFRKALMKAPTDSFEFIRRIGCHRMGLCGDEQFIPVLIEAYINDQNSARVIFNIEQSLLCFDKDKVLNAIENRFTKANFCDAPKYKAALIKLVSANPSQSSLETITDHGQKDRWRKFYISFLKNRPYHQIIPQVLTELEDESNSDFIRVQLAEALAWFTLSTQRDKIVASCRRVLDSGTCSPELKQELTRACSRLQPVK